MPKNYKVWYNTRNGCPQICKIKECVPSKKHPNIPCVPNKNGKCCYKCNYCCRSFLDSPESCDGCLQKFCKHEV